MDKLKSAGKSFEISKWEVWEAYRQVKANKGAPGVDKVTLEDFETDLRGNLYRIWNRMSAGSYFPPPVKAVEIPKPHGGGTRVLGVPTISDRIAQTVAAKRLEAKVEPIFHPDSYGYRPNRSALDAVAACRKRCWKRFARRRRRQSTGASPLRTGPIWRIPTTMGCSRPARSGAIPGCCIRSWKVVWTAKWTRSSSSA